tara:strand:+ start:2897 stop:3127 length:231 start_codon:yes stop_codon:yes gene_type:complete
MNGNFSQLEKKVLFELEKSKYKEIYTLRDVKLMSQFSESTIRRAIRDGRLVKMQQVKNGRLMFTKKAVMNWLDGDK